MPSRQEDVEIEEGLTEKEKQKRAWKAITDQIVYSERYSDDVFEYRHVTLPKEIVPYIPKSYWNPHSETKVLRLLAEEEWRAIGIQQSPGWEHYEVHVPEPLILLFRRAKGFGAVSNKRK